MSLTSPQCYRSSIIHTYIQRMSEASGQSIVRHAHAKRSFVRTYAHAKRSFVRTCAHAKRSFVRTYAHAKRSFVHIILKSNQHRAINTGCKGQI